MWNADVTFEASWDNYVGFDKFFSSKLRALLVQDCPRIPILLQLLRPKEYPTRLIVRHNWVDIIPYSVSIFFRVYGFQGCPHVLPFQVPLLVGVAEFLWKLGMVEDRELLGKGKGTLFPNVTSAHHFVFKNPGYMQLETFLNNYKIAQSSARFIDPEGFYEIFMQRIKARKYTHSFYYPEDIVKNELSLLE